MVEIDSYISRLIDCSPWLIETISGARKNWGHDAVPPTTLLGDMGLDIADNFDNIDEEEIVKLFELVELGLEDDHPELCTAVATGLIEALVNRSLRTEGLWPRVEQRLGVRSKRFAAEWIAF